MASLLGLIVDLIIEAHEDKVYYNRRRKKSFLDALSESSRLFDPNALSSDDLDEEDEDNEDSSLPDFMKRGADEFEKNEFVKQDKVVSTPKSLENSEDEYSMNQASYTYDKNEFKNDEINHDYQEELSSSDDSTNSTSDLVKLEILLLNYMFNEDDGKITRKESKAIKKHFAKYKTYFSIDDINEIKDFDNNDKSLMNIRAYISQNNITEHTIRKGISTLREFNDNSNTYGTIISRIEQSLLFSMGY